MCLVFWNVFFFCVMIDWFVCTSLAPSSAGVRRDLAYCGVSGAKFCDRKPEMLLAGGFMVQNLWRGGGLRICCCSYVCLDMDWLRLLRLRRFLLQRFGSNSGKCYRNGRRNEEAFLWHRGRGSRH